MKEVVLDLARRLATNDQGIEKVIPWGSPITSFGDPRLSRFATLGINPSNLEFVDATGNELDGTERRFHTLRSLELANWAEISAEDAEKILESCSEYFHRNPYGRWFNKLEAIISQAGFSYYSRDASACHLDLIPYATEIKWGGMEKARREHLFGYSSDALGKILQNSSIDVVLLNGASVIDMLRRISDVDLASKFDVKMNLNRADKPPVRGRTYSGHMARVGGIELERSVKVIGFNHNIQSSFGVTGAVIRELSQWVSRELEV